MIQKNRITKEGYSVLKKKYDDLIIELDNISRDMSSAREAGDLRENADYKTSHDRISTLRRDLGALREKLDNAIVVETNATDKAIQFGTKFLAIMPAIFDDSNAHECQLVGELESDLLSGLFSETSEIGKSLVGRKENDEFHINQKIYTKITKVF